MTLPNNTQMTWLDPVYCNLIPVDPASEESHRLILPLYYTSTRSLKFLLPQLERVLSPIEQERAKQFRFESDRDTYIASHACLRLLLAKIMKLDPACLIFSKGEHNKPYLKGSPVYFNLSHTRNEFAIAYSVNFPLGIDLEEIKYDIELEAIMRHYFSEEECDFISQGGDKHERFTLLWTRKEALLKSIGTGLIDDLAQVQVDKSLNPLNPAVFSDLLLDYPLSSQVIYSSRVDGNHLSICISRKAQVRVKLLHQDTIKTLLLN